MLKAWHSSNSTWTKNVPVYTVISPTMTEMFVTSPVRPYNDVRRDIYLRQTTALLQEHIIIEDFWSSPGLFSEAVFRFVSWKKFSLLENGNLCFKSAQRFRSVICRWNVVLISPVLQVSTAVHSWKRFKVHKEPERPVRMEFYLFSIFQHGRNPGRWQWCDRLLSSCMIRYKPHMCKISHFTRF